MILVVGGSGRLGQLVVEDLISRHDVRVLAPHATATLPAQDTRLEVVDGDVRDLATVAAAAKGVSCIVVASHGVESRERDGLETIDGLGSLAVTAAATEVASSVVLMSVVGAAADSPLPLGRTKFAAEQRIRESGVPWTIVRCAAFAQTWAMILTLSAGDTGRPAIIGRGEAAHRFVDVRDVASVVARASTDTTLRGRVLQVSGPQPRTVSQLATMVQQANSWTGAPRHLPVPLVRAIAPILAPFRPDITRKLRLGIAMNEPQPADDASMDVPSWLVPRPITLETVRAASNAVTRPNSNAKRA